MKKIQCDYCEKEIIRSMDAVAVDIQLTVEAPTMGGPEYDSGELDFCKKCTELIGGSVRTTFIQGMAAKFKDTDRYTCLSCCLYFETKKGLEYHLTHNCPYNTIAG